MPWIVEYLNDVVLAEAAALPVDQRARLQRIVGLIETYGLERVGEPHLKHLEGPLWEMRVSGRDGTSRAVYVTTSGRRVVILRVFVKKTRSTPRREIELALARARQVR